MNLKLTQSQPVPQASKTDELRALVRKHSHKAATGYSTWTFDDYTYENLKSVSSVSLKMSCQLISNRNYLLNTGDSSAKKAANKAGATRDDLVKAAQSAYASASSAGGSSYASVTSYLSQATDSAKKNTFDTWSESELKSYLDSYGIVGIQSSNLLFDANICNSLSTRAPRLTNFEHMLASSRPTSSMAPPPRRRPSWPSLARAPRPVGSGCWIN